MAANPLTVQAYAKINLSLEVIGRRADGYHDVATILQTVDLADTVTISRANGLSVECAGPDLSGEQNIAWPAAIALARRGGVEPNAHVAIEKRIPVAAGLGGGSADAAAVLRGLNAFWDINAPRSELAAIASALGSDVPFLLTGGTALGTGRGDVLEYGAAEPVTEFLLVTPAATIARKTPTLYGALNPADFSDGSSTRRLFESGGLDAPEFDTGQCRNTFTRAALQIFPGLMDVWDRVSSVTVHRPCLSGAGPSFFCAPSDQSELDAVVAALKDTGANACLLRTINPAQAV